MHPNSKMISILLKQLFKHYSKTYLGNGLDLGLVLLDSSKHHEILTIDASLFELSRIPIAAKFACLIKKICFTSFLLVFRLNSVLFCNERG